MGSKSKKPQPQRVVTHEPREPKNWPFGHVSVEYIGNDANVDECVKIVIHGSTHYLHATTARELEKMVHHALDEHNSTVDIANRIHGTQIPRV